MIEFKILKTLSDGGTLIIRNIDGWCYYVDRRTNTKTYNKVYKSYPSEKELVNFKKEKEILTYLKQLEHGKN